MIESQIKIAYQVLKELENECTASQHNSIIVVKNLLANKLMEIELSKQNG